MKFSLFASSLLGLVTSCVMRTPPPQTAATCNVPVAAVAAPPPTDVRPADAVDPFRDLTYGGTTYGGTTYGGTTYGSTHATTAATTTASAAYGYASAGSGTNVATSSSSASTSISTEVAFSSRLDSNQLAIARTFIVRLAGDHQLNTVLLRFVNDASGRASLVAAAPRGGLFVAAAHRTPTARNEYANVATIYRVDAAGVVVWTADVGDLGFATFEVPSVIATSDGGAIAHVLAYRHPARNANHRFVKVDRDGHRVWAVQLPGSGDTDSPIAEVMRADGRGGIELDGYLVQARELTDKHDWRGHLHTWSGAITADGLLLRNVTGDLMPLDARIGSWPAQDAFWDEVAPRR